LVAKRLYQLTIGCSLITTLQMTWIGLNGMNRIYNALTTQSPNRQATEHTAEQMTLTSLVNLHKEKHGIVWWKWHWVSSNVVKLLCISILQVSLEAAHFWNNLKLSILFLCFSKLWRNSLQQKTHQSYSQTTAQYLKTSP
jgi:hypothetical protein